MIGIWYGLLVNADKTCGKMHRVSLPESSLATRSPLLRAISCRFLILGERANAAHALCHTRCKEVTVGEYELT